MTKKLVADVAARNRDYPRNVEVEKRSESTERAGEGPSNPLQVGLLAPPRGPLRGTSTRTPKGTPKITLMDLAVVARGHQGGVATPLPITIPPPIAPPQEGNAVPPAPPSEQAKVVAPNTKVPRTKLVPGPAKNTPAKAKASAPRGSTEAQLVDVIPRRPRRATARRINSPEIEEVQEGTPEEALQEQAQEDGDEEGSEEETKKHSPFIADCDNFPKYLRKVLHVDHEDDGDHLTAELGMLTAGAFCDDFIAGTLTMIQDHSSALFKYICWMAQTLTV
ncbi:unnamed protein product [Calypogeia fissa]